MNRFFFIVIFFTCYALSAQISSQNQQIELIDVLHYRFDLKFNDTTDILEANANIEILFLDSATQFYLDLNAKEGNKGMNVKSVFSGNDSLRFKQENDKLYIYNNKWKKSDIVKIDIKYSGIPSDGLIISKNKYGAKTIFGDNWPNRAHNWLPVIDHPSDKAVVEFVVEVPATFDVIASGVLKEKIKVNDHINRYHYITDIPLPTKVMVIGVADFNFLHYGEVDSVPVSSMIFSAAPDSGLDDYRYSMEVLRFYIDSIGEYPFEKLVNVQSNTIYGGMENAGNIFYFENSVDGNKNYEDLIAHEIAHQWFGDAVTEKDWPDIWLSEGFATYITSMYIEHKYGEEAFLERMIKDRETVISYNSYKPSAVVDYSIVDLNRLLNPNTYQKASWILHMLRKKTGDRDFYRILRAFYKKFRNSNAESSDFVRVVNEITKAGYSSFFDQWLYKKGVPELLIKWSVENNILYVEIAQKGEVFTIDLPVRIECENVNESFVLKIKNKVETYALPLKSGFNSNNLKLIPDPEISILQKNKVERVNLKPERIPLIEGTGLLKAGDLLFQDLDCGPLCDAIESVTRGYKGAHFSHVGIVVPDGAGQLKIAEAIGESVRLTDFNEFISRYLDVLGRPKVVVGRIKDNMITVNALDKIGKYIGKTYDDIYDIDDDKYYCSELVYYIYTDKNNNYLFQLYPMTFKDSITGQVFPSWKKYFDTLNTTIPEGNPGINPGSISKSDKLDIIYRYGNPEGWQENEK
jgi:aminopeptidase N